MLRKITLGACLALTIASQAFAQNQEEKPASKEDFSYAYGVLFGQSMKSQGFDASSIDMDAFMKAINESFEGKKLKFSDQEAQKIVMSRIQELMARKARAKELENQKFLDENAQKEGVKILESGIQYVVLKEGNGPTPSASDKVTTHYHGTLINGTVFDSSVERNNPATFPVNGVIKGWQEVLQLMNTGAKWKVFIPAHLAYGNRNTGKIPANSLLIFEIELLEIVK